MLINRWSCRVTLFIGGLVSSSGQFASAYAGNIHTLFVTFGLITGECQCWLQAVQGQSKVVQNYVLL